MRNDNEQDSLFLQLRRIMASMPIKMVFILIDTNPAISHRYLSPSREPDRSSRVVKGDKLNDPFYELPVKVIEYQFAKSDVDHYREISYDYAAKDGKRNKSSNIIRIL